MVAKLVSLFLVLILFYVLGSILKWTLNSFEKQNEEKREQEKAEADGEENEPEADGGESETAEDSGESEEEA